MPARDIDRYYVPDYPKHEVTEMEYLAAVRAEQRRSQDFWWHADGVEHDALVAYDVNGMAIGYVDDQTHPEPVGEVCKFFLFD